MVGNSTFATPETLARMPYLKAWLRETLRLYPVLSAIPRRPKDIILGGYHIPGGTAQVEFLVHQMGWDEGILEDAEAFKPERWLRNKDTALIESAEAFASLPFGFGTSMCLGRRIAELELHLAMARIVQQFDISYPTRYVLRVSSKQHSTNRAFPFIALTGGVNYTNPRHRKHDIQPQL